MRRIQYIKLSIIFALVLILFPYERVYSLPPDLTNCPLTDIVGQWDEQFIYDLDAEDPEMDPITYILISGPGEVDSATGVWSWTPDCQDVGSHVVEICVRDSSAGCPSGNECSFTVTVGNSAPVIDGPCDEVVLIGPGWPDTVRFTATDANEPDDTLIWYVYCAFANGNENNSGDPCDCEP